MNKTILMSSDGKTVTRVEDISHVYINSGVSEYYVRAYLKCGKDVTLGKCNLRDEAIKYLKTIADLM